MTLVVGIVLALYALQAQQGVYSEPHDSLLWFDALVVAAASIWVLVFATGEAQSIARRKPGAHWTHIVGQP